MSTSNEILTELYWSFFEEFSTQEEFNKELTQYNTRILKPKPKLDQIVIVDKKVVIQFLVLEDLEDENPDYEEEKQIILETTNPKGFTLSNLMFQVNNKVISEYNLHEKDLCFFEGFEYLGDDDPEYPQTKVYYMILGS